MKTCELAGAALDFWVAKAEGFEAEIRTDDCGSFCVRTERFERGGHARGPFSPSKEWPYGGPIIERARISIACIPATPGRADLAEFWTGSILTDREQPNPAEGGVMEVFANAHGSTPLIAAMRAYVEATFGPELPE